MSVCFDSIKADDRRRRRLKQINDNPIFLTSTRGGNAKGMKGKKTELVSAATERKLGRHEATGGNRFLKDQGLDNQW